MKKMGAGALFPIGSFASQQGSTEKLPELRNQDGVVKWLEVPQSWAAQKRRAEKVSNALKNRYANDEGVVEVGIVASPEKFGDKRGLQVEVGIDKSKIKTEIEDHVDNVPVQTTEKPEAPVDLCLNTNYSGLPGGVKIYDSDTSPYSIGTTAWKVDWYGDCILTAAHTVEDTYDVYGDPTLSPQKVGGVALTESASATDVAVLSSNRNIPNKIIGDGSTYQIGGWVTESGISSRVSDFFDGYRQMGITTGETEGGLGKYHIGDSYHSGTPSYDGHGVRGSADVAKGDSGGPAFSLHNGDAYVTHIVTQGDPKGGRYTSNSNCYDTDPFKKSIGTAAYYLNNEYPIQGSSHS
ncbi:chymotrypsin family serine protease [Haladaptatus cibarius]|uniref:hypothetical protein n=1 Tax=Haladaptatus cibarius TaxID=453847 RepID=UPI000A96A3B4|nr:hypothetical protein [Haladaptatus cibarius]